MASVSLVSSPQTPVLDKNMTDSELAGDEREDGELEDGEIDDEGIGIEEEKEAKEAPEEKEKDVKEKDPKEKELKEKERDDKAHRHSRKRYKKTREKHKSKRRRRDRQKHHSPSSVSSSDSYDSDYDRPEKPKTRKSQGSSQEPNGQSSQRGRESRGGLHPASQRKSPQAKGGDPDKYSDFGNEKYDYEGEDDDYEDDGGGGGGGGGGSEFGPSRESGGFGGGGKGRHGKDQMKRANQRGLQKQQQQQFGGPRGRGRGMAAGRGRGMLKNKKLKGKGWGGRGRGQGGDQGMDGGPQHQQDGKNSFQKKRPIMSKEFINQHTVEHNGRYICKYFLEGRCIKGEQCKFEHELVVPDKKKELCKFYLQGYCSKGDNCIYMHSEYPCKFFHTGAKCYQGDNCKFSHDSLNDVTKDLLDKIISTEEENAHEDEIELENLRKQGIAPLPKPPPGVGLLPTPGQGSPQEAGASGQAGKKIPSLFEIKVQPTVEMAQKIGLSGSKFDEFDEESSDQFGGEPEEMEQGGAAVPPGSGAPSGPPPESPGPPMAHPNVGPPPGPLSPPPPLHGYSMPPPPFPPGGPPPFMGNRPPMSSPPPMSMGPRPPFPPMPDLQMLQSLFPFPPLGQNPMELFSNFLRSQSMPQGVDPSVSFLQNLQQQMGAESQIQSLPPAVQKALFLHITQQQQQQHPPKPPHQQGMEPQRGDAPEDKGSIRDETTNWYSSDEEDGGCVSSILKSLKKQNEMHQRQQNQLGPPQPPTGDPRLLKERAPPSDPRVKSDPRQRHPDPKKDSDGASDPRLARDPRKVRPAEPPGAYRQQKQPPPSHKPPAGEDDEEGERELRDRATLIPLDPGPGLVLRDPRSQLQQFSHIRVDILLQRPAFADAVVWGPEDLLPSLVPKQEHSINLPLPPLIAEAQKDRVNRPEAPPSHAPPAIDPRAVAARLKEGVVRMPPSRNLESRSSMERPLDPRQLKALDPRIKRAGSLDCKPSLPKEGPAPGGGAAAAAVVDPRLQRAGAVVSAGSAAAAAAAARSTPEAEKLPPYAPRLASSTTGGLESPAALLGGISLYDPRQPSAEHGPKEPAEAPKKTGILKHHPAKKDTTSTPTTPPQPPTPPPPSSSSRSPTRPRAPPAEESRAADSPSDGSPTHHHRRPSPGALSPVAAPVAAPASPVKPPAVHILPVQTLPVLTRPQYADPRQAKPAGQGSAAPPPPPDDTEASKEEPGKKKKVEEVEKGKAAEEEEGEKKKEGPQEEAGPEGDDDRTLKDVFKTFDPTASPFCQ